VIAVNDKSGVKLYLNVDGVGREVLMERDG
jgi:hypothetical protein